MSETRNAQLWRDALPQLQRASLIPGYERGIIVPVTQYLVLRSILIVPRHVSKELCMRAHVFDKAGQALHVRQSVICRCSKASLKVLLFVAEAKADGVELLKKLEEAGSEQFKTHPLFEQQRCALGTRPENLK